MRWNTQIFTSVFFLLSTSLFSQYGEIRLKEDYDVFTKQLVSNYRPCTLSTDNDHTVFGDGMAYILDGYLSMYECTQDKDYLYKFMLQSMCMMENRHDFSKISSEPRWGNLTYEEGNINGAFAKFVHFIKIKNKDLDTFKVYPFTEFSNNSFDITFNTFGDYASWLSSRVDEALSWFISNGYWSDELGFLDKPNTTGSLIINKHIGFARAVLFMGLSGNSEYEAKSKLIESLFFKDIEFYDRHERKHYEAPLFIKNEKGAYWWYHFGWTDVRKKRKIRFKWSKGSPSIEKYTSFIEDISHGGIVALYPLDQWVNNSETAFDEQELAGFHKTFTQNIYDGNGGFYNAVNGSDNPISDNYCTTCPHNYHAMKSLIYSPYAAFDGVLESDSVYTIIMDYYQNAIDTCSSLPPGYCCGINYGHAELIKRQWTIEQFNLSLYNRIVVYDQDFRVKGTLTIDPESTTTTSFAEPKTNDKVFIIQTGVKSEFEASYIHIKPGTQFKSGSKVHIAPVQPKE
jgi:hypothetical protein